MTRAAIITALCLCAGNAATAQDTVRTYTASDIVVHADPLAQPWRLDRPLSTSASVDELMRMGGLTLVQRANGFAGEVTMRGLRGGQISTTIDGMKIHAACVDKMDPSTAYIEIDNVSAMQVDGDGSDLRYGQTLGGAVNFKLQQSRYATPLHSVIDGTLESNAAMRRLRVELGGGTKDISFRTGYTVREVRNMVAGNGAEVPLSGYSKQNLHVAAGWKPTASAEFEAMMIADHVRNVGYPALLMDTRHADAMIAALTWRERWSPFVQTSVKLYANTVDHVMDDYDRPIDQIMERRFMPGMYMPMRGATSVMGALMESAVVSAETVLGVTLDATLMRTSATMEMVPIDTSVTTMRMSNIGDVGVGTIGFAATLDHAVDCDLSVQASARIDAVVRTIHDELFKSILSGYYPGSTFASRAAVPALTAGGTWDVTDALQVALVLGYAERMPTHLELFGLMIYDPQADIVTNGNPDLRNERALSSTLQYRYNAGGIRIMGSMYLRLIDDYIAPSPTTHVVWSESTPQTRTMANIGRALINGADVQCTMPVASWVTMQGTLRACWGKSITWNDALPLINPVTLTWRTVLGGPAVQGEIQFVTALAQHNASQLILVEDATAQWWTVNVLLAWRPAAIVSLQVSATNLLDAYYHEHTSINNMPARGRSLNVGMRVNL